jgi:hypothetical protein
MPAANRRQQKALYAKKGKAWVKKHHYDKIRKKKR